MAPEAYSQLCQFSKVEVFVKIINGFKPSPKIVKSFILNVSRAA